MKPLGRKTVRRPGKTVELASVSCFQVVASAAALFAILWGGAAVTGKMKNSLNFC
jgi:hypothetical protein